MACDHMSDLCKAKFDSIEKRLEKGDNEFRTMYNSVNDVKLDIREILTEQKAQMQSQKELQGEIKKMIDNNSFGLKQILWQIILFALGIISSYIVFKMKGA